MTKKIVNPLQPKQREKIRTRKAMIVGDVHGPYQADLELNLIFDFASFFQPDDFYCLGDWADFYQVSSFCKDPSRALELQKDIDVVKGLLRELRRRLPKANIVYLNGNHEDRLRKYLNYRPEISSLKSLTIPELLELPSMRIAHHEYSEQLQWHGLLLEHGDRACSRSGYTAAAMLQRRGVSGVSAHVHRLATHYRTDNRGTEVWAENGCACSLSPEYIIGKPDWQHGFSVAYAIEGSNRFSLAQIPVLDGRIFYEGYEFK